MSDEPDYRAGGLTVWFKTMPEGNPFKIASEFGDVCSVSRGNSMDEADIYRSALEEIIDCAGFGRVVSIAEKAINAVDAGQKEFLAKIANGERE